MKYLIAIIGIFSLLLSCEETEILNESGKLNLTEIKLPDLPDNYYYEGWLLVDGSYVSVGNITNDSIANDLAQFSEIEINDLATAQSFAITVETSGSSAPSNYVLLVGEFNGNEAILSSSAEISNGVLSLANRISASYTVQNATISTEDADAYSENGIWFFKGSGSNVETTLSLYYNDVVYQAWLRNKQNNVTRYLNMGIISSDTISDSWKSFTLYPNNTPDFSGEDFLVDPEGDEDFPENYFPLDVRGSDILISPIPSSYSSSTTPFPIFLLKGTIPEDATKDVNLTRELTVNTDFSAKAIRLQ